MSEGPEWFAPKRFGIGSGLPIAWQGWAVLATYLAVIVLSAAAFGDRSLVTVAILAPITGVFILVLMKTTRGGWRWRRGEED